MLITQSCAPGLVWRPDRSQCDFPSSKSCTDKRQGVPAAVIDNTNSASTVMQLSQEQKPSM